MARRSEPIELTWPQVHAFRLRRHRLDPRAARKDLAAVVRDVGGVQAQVFSAAQLSLRARVRDLTSEHLDKALWRDVRLVKTWAARSTLHLIPARDYGLYAAALRPVEERDERRIARYLAPEEHGRAVAAVMAALEAGPLSRRELTERVVAIAGPKLRAFVETGWGGVVKLASLQGRLCHGPSEGQEVTFARAVDWIPDLKDVEPREAEDEFLRRYLGAFGPATVSDYSAWSGIPVRDARPAWNRLADDLMAVDVAGTEAFALLRDRTELTREPPRSGTVRLLPSFDTFLLGHKDKSHLVGAKHYKRVYRKAAWLSPAVLVDGRVAGVWRYKKRGRGWRISVDLFGRAGRGVRTGIKEESQDIGRFLGGDATVAYA